MEPPAIRRICLTVQYDGSAFYGWQLQPQGRTVQGEIERVVSRLFAAPTRVLGSGRTDRGVHAVGQVAAVDAPPKWEGPVLRRAMNALLPRDVWIADAREVAPRFHPRYDALSRSYVYRVGTEEATQSPFHARWCWPVSHPLDVEKMRRAATALPGDHSFRALAKAGQEHRGDRCIVTRAEWLEWPGLGLELRIAANRFLHHMVRYIVGTLVEIGSGRRSVEDMARLLEGDPSVETSPPAPAQGLFLHAVEYPPPPYGPGPAEARSTGRSLPSLI